MADVQKYITDTRSSLSAEKVESVELIRWRLRAGLMSDCNASDTVGVCIVTMCIRMMMMT